MSKEVDLSELAYEADRMTTLISYQYDLFGRIHKDVAELAKTSNNTTQSEKITETMAAISVLFEDVYDIANGALLPALNKLSKE